MNEIFLMGRLTKDSELNPSGKVATNSIAVDRRLKDSDGNTITDFINLRWLGERNAKFAWDYLKKGMKILIEGSLCIESYTGNDGIKRTACYVVVNNTEFAESKKQGGNDQSNPKPVVNADGFMSIPDGCDDEPPFL